MGETEPYHTDNFSEYGEQERPVYHTYDDCQYGKRIEPKYRTRGKGEGRDLCAACRLRSPTKAYP